MWWIIIIVVVVLLVSIIIITSAVSLHKPTVEEIGEAGEAQVREVIEDYNGEQYVFNNYMATRENKTSQIDHIVINKYGVFVIETKIILGQFTAELPIKSGRRFLLVAVLNINFITP